MWSPHLQVWQPLRMETFSQKYQLASFFRLKSAPNFINNRRIYKHNPGQSLPPDDKCHKMMRSPLQAPLCSPSALHFYLKSPVCTRAARVRLSGSHPSNGNAGWTTEGRGVRAATRFYWLPVRTLEDDFTQRNYRDEFCVLNAFNVLQKQLNTQIKALI